MKRIYSILFILCLSLGTVFAQTPSNRTANTIIADVLAQLPANNQANYNQKMKDLVSTGEAGILALVQKLNPSGKGSNAPVDYALSGITRYVSAPGQEATRQIVVSAYKKALDTASDTETKAFLNEQLRMLGENQQEILKKPLLEKIKAFLNEEEMLSGDYLDIADRPWQPLSGKVGKTSPTHLRIAALQRDMLTIMLKKYEFASWMPVGMQYSVPIEESDREKKLAAKLLSALKDPSAEYRNAALDFASPFAGRKIHSKKEVTTETRIYTALLKALPKAKPEVKTDILNWLGREAQNPEKRETLVAIETKIDVTATQSVINELGSDDFAVKESAARALVRFEQPQAISALTALLTSNDTEILSLAKSALSSYKGNISDEVAAVIPTTTESGIIAGLELLAHRKADKHLNVVLSYLNSTNPKLQTAAYTALKDVATPESLPALSAQLQLAPANAVSAVQQAIVAAIRSYPVDKKLEIITQNMNLAAANNKQYLFYPLLATTGDPKALNTIIERFSKESGTAKEAAFQALLNWNGIEVADELYKIGQSTSTFSAKATDSYIKLASDTKLSGENRRIFLTNALEIAKTDAQKNEILKQLGQTNSYLGLLLAGEYLDKPAVQQAAANAVRDIALNNKNFTGKNIRQLLEKVSKVLDNPDAGYQKEAIRKHLNEMPDEEGFVSIFNGKDLTHWKGLVGNPLTRAKMKPAELAKAQVKANEQMRKDWKVENGLLVFDGTGYDNICTEKLYGDFEMYVDWQLEPSPEADAGIYLRGTPQVQMWNIERTNVGAQVGSGGLYNNQTNPSKPLKVADNKLGEWNNLYIKMIGDRVTVLLNGELVVDQVILENYWDRSQAIFPVEQIELQAHGSKVYYKNIYVKELERPKPFELSAQEKKEGFQMLFDGTNMHEWTGNLADYLLEEGTISVHPGQSYGGNLYTKKEYADFAFRFEFQLTPSANNGVGIRSSMKGDDAYNAMEIQILDCEHPVYKDIEPYQHHGSVYGVIAAEHGAMKPVGEWNEEEIYAKGDHIRVTLNGKVILDGNIREAAKNGTIDHKEHPGLFNKTGHIGFLGHGNELKFRNIRIKEIK